MGGKTLHREPFDLLEVIALGKKQIFFISLFDKRAFNENISPGAMEVNIATLVVVGREREGEIKPNLLREVLLHRRRITL